MGLIIAGKTVTVRGLTIKSWHDVPAYRLRIGQPPSDGHHCGPRTIHGLVLHSSKGIPGGSDHRPQFVKPGAGPGCGANACARWWSTSPAQAGAHLVIDRDGSIACLADLVYEVAYHAGSNNAHTVGIECYQDGDGGIWGATIAAAVALVDTLCTLLGLPKQVHWPYSGGPVPRLEAGKGLDYRGIYGHRDCSGNRGPGDPGDLIMQALLDARFQPVNVLEDEDLERWKERQEACNAAGCSPPLVVDGIPGPKTLTACARLGVA